MQRYLLQGILDKQAGDNIGVDIGSRAAVLEVPVALELDGQGNADGSAAVRGSC